MSHCPPTRLLQSSYQMFEELRSLLARGNTFKTQEVTGKEGGTEGEGEGDGIEGDSQGSSEVLVMVCGE